MDGVPRINVVVGSFLQADACNAARPESSMLSQIRSWRPWDVRNALCTFRASSLMEARGPRAAGSGAARAWGRAKRARNRYTVLNTTETIWYSFERVRLRNDGAMVTGILFGVTYLYWKESSAREAENPTGVTLPAARLARNSDRSYRLGGTVVGISLQGQFDDPSDAIITKSACE